MFGHWHTWPSRDVHELESQQLHHDPLVFNINS
jgi:hypothetical protein